VIDGGPTIAGASGPVSGEPQCWQKLKPPGVRAMQRLHTTCCGTGAGAATAVGVPQLRQNLMLLGLSMPQTAQRADNPATGTGV
jgi:hypothetical protein